MPVTDIDPSLRDFFSAPAARARPAAPPEDTLDPASKSAPASAAKAPAPAPTPAAKLADNPVVQDFQAAFPASAAADAGAGDASLKDRVGAARQSGRQLQAANDKMTQTRGGLAKEGLVDLALGAGGLAATALTGGISAAPAAIAKAGAAAAASAAYGTRRDTHKGESSGSAAAKNVASAAVGAIPVVGDVISTVKGAATIGRAAFESDKTRAKDKIALAQSTQARSSAEFERVEGLMKEVQASGHSKEDRDVMQRQLGKALIRTSNAEAAAQKTILKQEDKAVAPLALSAAGGPLPTSSASEEGIAIDPAGFGALAPAAADADEDQQQR